jgi:hypothetical protein
VDQPDNEKIIKDKKSSALLQLVRNALQTTNGSEPCAISVRKDPNHVRKDPNHSEPGMDPFKVCGALLINVKFVLVLNGSEDEWKAAFWEHIIVTSFIIKCFGPISLTRTGDHFIKWHLQTVVIKIVKFQEKDSVYPVFLFVPRAVLNLSFFSFQKEYF